MSAWATHFVEIVKIVQSWQKPVTKQKRCWNAAKFSQKEHSFLANLAKLFFWKQEICDRILLFQFLRLKFCENSSSLPLVYLLSTRMQALLPFSLSQVIFVGFHYCSSSFASEEDDQKWTTTTSLWTLLQTLANFPPSPIMLRWRRAIANGCSTESEQTIPVWAAFVLPLIRLRSGTHPIAQARKHSPCTILGEEQKLSRKPEQELSQKQEQELSQKPEQELSQKKPLPELSQKNPVHANNPLWEKDDFQACILSFFKHANHSSETCNGG